MSVILKMVYYHGPSTLQVVDYHMANMLQMVYYHMVHLYWFSLLYYQVYRILQKILFYKCLARDCMDTTSCVL